VVQGQHEQVQQPAKEAAHAERLRRQRNARVDADQPDKVRVAVVHQREGHGARREQVGEHQADGQLQRDVQRRPFHERHRAQDAGVDCEGQEAVRQQNGHRDGVDVTLEQERGREGHGRAGVGAVHGFERGVWSKRVTNRML